MPENNRDDKPYTVLREFREDVARDRGRWCRMLGRLCSGKGPGANAELFNLVGVWMEKHRKLVEEVVCGAEKYLES